MKFPPQYRSLGTDFLCYHLRGRHRSAHGQGQRLNSSWLTFHFIDTRGVVWCKTIRLIIICFVASSQLATVGRSNSAADILFSDPCLKPTLIQVDMVKARLAKTHQFTLRVKILAEHRKIGLFSLFIVGEMFILNAFDFFSTLNEYVPKASSDSP